MKYKGVLAVALIFTSIGTYADSIKHDIAKCAASNSDASRLICYDELAKKLGVDKPAISKLKGSGDWSVRSEKSPIDDSLNVYLSLRAESEIRSGYKRVRPTLIVRCAENKTNVFLTWDLFLGIDTTKMLTRFDNQQATTDTWSVSTDNQAVFYRGDGHINFAKKLMNHQKLLAQITPYGESPVMATFNISGLSEAIKPLRDACKW